MPLPLRTQFEFTPLSLSCLTILGVLSTPSVMADEFEHIRVTAHKREQLLANIDASLQIVNAAELERAGVSQVAELEKVFPGLIIRSRGNRAYPAISLRGMSTPNFYSPTVQLYLDGIPQDMAFITQPLVNVERVELLKGPQASLYGGNAYAGVINIVTRNAGEESRAKVQAQAGRLDYSTGVSVASGITEHGIYADASWQWSREKGEIDDVSSGLNDINDGKEYSLSGRLGYGASDSPFSVIFSAAKSKLTSNEEVYVREAEVENKRYYSQLQGPGGRLIRDVDSYGLNLSYQRDGVSFSSITAWQDRELQRYLSGRNYPETQRSFSQEFRAGFSLGNSDNLLGLYLDKQDFSRKDPGFPGYSGPSVNLVDKKSQALFAESRWSLAPKWALTTGLRWEKNTASINYQRTGLGVLSFGAEKSFYSFSPKVSLGWQYDSANHLYLNVSRGFKPGGFNHAVSHGGDKFAYEPETSVSSELGWRGTALEQQLSFNSALYWITSKDKQLYVGPLGRQVLRNMGDARSYGVEMDVNWSVSSQLTLAMAATIGRSQLDNTLTSAGADFDGHQMPYTSNQQYNMSLDYRFEQSWLEGELSLNVAARYYSRLYFNEGNTLQQPAYTLTDLALVWQASDDVQWKLFVDNISDKTYRTSSFAFGPGDIRSTLSDGRNLGLSMVADF